MRELAISVATIAVDRLKSVCSMTTVAGRATGIPIKAERLAHSAAIRPACLRATESRQGRMW
jgi:hypothetical protein